jgi:hypothetical protein
MVMKLINKTDYSAGYLRQIVKWVSREIGFKPYRAHTITFANSRRRSWSYRWSDSHNAAVLIAGEQRFPRPQTSQWPAMPDRDTALMHATACVIGFFAQAQESVKYQRGPVYAKASELVAKFQDAQAALGAAAMAQEDVNMIYAKVGLEGFEIVDAPPQPIKPVVTPAQKRARKVEADLLRWQRKLKLAEGKIKKLKRRAAYYARTAR